MAVSRSLRGSSMPVDPVVYTTGLTLIVFLLLRLPGARKKVRFERAEGDEDIGPKAAAITLLLSGALTLSVQHWAAPTHTMNGGVNYADAFHVPMTLAGWGLILFGIGLLVWARLPKVLQDMDGENTLGIKTHSSRPGVLRDTPGYPSSSKLGLRDI
jgi:hypothetical protein